MSISQGPFTCAGSKSACTIRCRCGIVMSLTGNGQVRLIARPDPVPALPEAPDHREHEDQRRGTPRDSTSPDAPPSALGNTPCLSIVEGRAGLDPSRTVAELEELRELTGDENGAQRVAWTETWEPARAWLREKVAVTGAREERDEAGNQWFTLPGRPRTPC